MKEPQHTEWKESWRDDYLRWVCGFANAEGGTLLAEHASVPFNPDVANAFFRSGHSVKTSVKTPLEILRLLTATRSMTMAEVASRIGKPPRAIELAASKLVKEGRLKYVGSKKGGHWEVIL